MSMNDSYYQPPEDRAWEAYCDETDEPTEEGFEEWCEEQEDRAEDAAIERAESAREDRWDD